MFIKKSLPSFCTSNFDVIKAIILYAKVKNLPILIESTSSQVNQFGGYTNNKPYQFKNKIFKICSELNYPKKKIMLGADHLGPFPWLEYKGLTAWKNSINLLKSCIKSNYKKIHIDTCYDLKDQKKLSKKDIIKKSLDLFKIAKKKNIFFVFGTETPFPGSMSNLKEGFTKVETLKKEVNIYLKYFKTINYKSRFAYVIEPRMSFSHFKSSKPKILLLKKHVDFSKKKNFFFEAHSTDYQSQSVLRKLVLNNFKFLKVGPELTFFFLKAILAMEKIEKDFSKYKKSKITKVLLLNMNKYPTYWQKYYKGSKSYIQKLLLQSQLDRIRYYWDKKEVSKSIFLLKKNINKLKINLILSQLKYDKSKLNIFKNSKITNFEFVVLIFLKKTPEKYYKACFF